tara:strand:- start:202 stop:1293 length:1092 start_codon:yes stop_codon:yes gene_type:complete
MFDALKPLLDSGIVNEETKTEIQEAWETKLTETREEIRGELREEFSRRYEHDKTTMVESLDKMVNENLTKELENIVSERKALEEDRVRYNVRMSEQTDKVKSFMIGKLGAELSELNEDRKVQAETLDKLQKFVVKALAEEIAEFHKDKEAVVETRVKLVAEGKKQLSKLKETFIERSSKLVKDSVVKNLNTELTQLKEDIDTARQNNFGRKLFETFASEFATSHLNENSEIKDLQTAVANVTKQLAESNKVAVEKSTLVESKEAEIRRINDRIVRDQQLNEMMAPLSKNQKTVMQDLLENVVTDKLTGTFNKYLPAVLKNEVKAERKPHAIMESKEVTGNKKESVNAEDEGNIIEIKRLAGLN